MSIGTVIVAHQVGVRVVARLMRILCPVILPATCGVPPVRSRPSSSQFARNDPAELQGPAADVS